MELHDLDRVGTLLERWVSAGVNQVGGVGLEWWGGKEGEGAGGKEGGGNRDGGVKPG